MELADHGCEPIERWVARGSLVVFGLLSSIMLFLWLVPLWDWARQPVASEVSFPAVTPERLGSGLLAVDRYGDSPLSSLWNDLVLLGINTRPDAPHGGRVEFVVCSSGHRYDVALGESVMVSPGVTWVGKRLDRDGVTCVIQLDDRKIYDEQVMVPSPLFAKDLNQTDYVLKLREGRVWGRDLLLTGWGGAEYAHLAQCSKVALGGKVLFLRIGDCLGWDGVSWSLPRSDVPLAQLMGLSAQGASWRIWDVSGYSQSTTTMVHEEPAPFLWRADDLITSIRAHSASEVTCQLGKRRVMIKGGDWWVRSGLTWRRLRTAEDVEACLHHRLGGELFMFEAVEASKHEISVRGRMFDSTRTMSEEFVLRTPMKRQWNRARRSMVPR